MYADYGRIFVFFEICQVILSRCLGLYPHNFLMVRKDPAPLKVLPKRFSPAPEYPSLSRSQRLFALSGLDVTAGDVLFFKD